MLLQRLVESPLLVRGRKFSVRIYTVLVGDRIFLSRDGLVKLAAEPYNDDDNSSKLNPRVHLTNSGRELEMEQQTLDILSVHGIDTLRSSLVHIVRTVMILYRESAVLTLPDQTFQGVAALPQLRARLASLEIPKILGFDFVVDTSLQVWLVEINRFPGLEPRSSFDAAVKHNVVRAAWDFSHDNEALLQSLDL